MAIKHFRRFAREWAMQYLFQNDITSFEDNRDESVLIYLSQLTDPEILADLPDKKIFLKACRIAKTIITGVLDNLTEIDAQLSKYSEKWSIDRMDIVDRNVMRVAVYEMLFCQNIPPVVSINEAVEIGKIYGTDNTASYINGVLNAVMGTLDRPSREAATGE